jgi:hypothetical protein
MDGEAKERETIAGVSSGASWFCLSVRNDALRQAMGIATKGT